MFTDDVVQLIQRLFQGVDNQDREFVMSTFRGLLRIRHLQPIDAVRGMDSNWRILGIEHSEDLLHDLSNFSMNRRDEFINALSPVVGRMQLQDVVETSQDASATSSLTSQSIVAEFRVSPSSTEPQVAPRGNPLFMHNFQGNMHNDDQERGSAVGLASDNSSMTEGQSNPQS